MYNVKKFLANPMIRRVLIIISWLGIVNFFTNIGVAVAVAKRYSLENNYLSDLATNTTEIFFNFAISFVIISQVPFFIMFYYSIIDESSEKYLRWAFRVLLSGIPFLIGLVIFDTYNYYLVHFILTQTFYYMMYTSIVLWSVGMLNMDDASPFKQTWIFFEPYVAIVTLGIMAVVHFYDNSYDPILQKFGVGSYLLIIAYIGAKLWYMNHKLTSKLTNSKTIEENTYSTN